MLLVAELGMGVDRVRELDERWVGRGDRRGGRGLQVFDAHPYARIRRPCRSPPGSSCGE